MARKKLSEFTAKTLLFKSLGIPYSGIPVILEAAEGEPIESLRDAIATLPHDKLYVVKADQGVKGRMKKGLVKLKVQKDKIVEAIKELSAKGYSLFLIEEFIPHDSSSERYLSMERTREGNIIYYANVGGIDIEQNQDKVKKVTLSNSSVILGSPEGTTPESLRDAGQAFRPSLQSEASMIKKEIDEIEKITKVLELSSETFLKILQFFDYQYISFLEINPLVILEAAEGEPIGSHQNKEDSIAHSVRSRMTGVHILDLAVEVDNTAEFFLPARPAGGSDINQGVKNGWNSTDLVGETRVKTEEEKNIADLQANSQASLKMEILNPNGSIFVMLFGGGGSIVVADEVFNQGKSSELANYSDYSGGPKEEETVIYVKNILQSMLKSNAKRKVFIVAGTYANFTDVTVTFKGFIRALESLKPQLEKQDVKIFIRRPGPGMKKGLSLIQEYLGKTKMLGGIWDQKMILSDVVLKALEYLKHD